MSNRFKTDNHQELAKLLSEQLIVEITKQGHATLAADIRTLRDMAWQDNTASKPPSKEEKEQVFATILGGLGKEDKTLLMDYYARLGHIYEIAGQAARYEYFNSLRNKNTPIPGGVKEFFAKQPDVATAIGRLNQPVFEVVMTMHPTNTNSLDFMRAQRALSKALEEGSEKDIEQAMVQFSSVPVLNQKDGKDTNFTVRDETGVVLNYLDNIYDDLPRIYGHFDRTLGKQLDLNLKMRFTSWGSAGDKDGNQNVTAETTLEAIAMHTDAIVKRYITDLQKIKGIASTPLEAWKKELKQASEKLTALKDEINELRTKSHPAYNEKDKLTPEASAERFDALSGRLAAIRNQLTRKTEGMEAGVDKAFGVDKKTFEQTLLDYYNQKGLTKAQKDGALDLIRKVRTFGFNFGKIEYRETAEEYSRVVEEVLSSVVPAYAGLTPQQRLETLTELLSEGGNAALRLFDRQRARVINGGACQPYHDDYHGNKGAQRFTSTKAEVLPIAYNTFKRMELARDFPDMITDNVLAECGRIDGKDHDEKTVAAQGAVNILEAKFIQRMAAKDGKEPLLGIVPLFEEPDTMMNIDHIMRAAYDNKVYKAHMESLKDRNGGEITQQVQIAHSDNARRSGLLAARAYIHEAHKKVRALNNEKGIKTQFFEGGSISDAYRNGVRALSASVNAFGLQDFTKFTFQGGDLVNYFTSPSSAVRLFTRNLTHAAERFREKDGKWVIEERKNTQNGGEAAGTQNRRPNSIMDDIAITAMKQTLKDYQEHDFQTDKMGVLLAALDYDAETKAGGRGSRAGNRGVAGGFKKVVSAITGIFKPINIEKVRTIGFSEAWQHVGIVPSWIGSGELDTHLMKEAKRVLDDMERNPMNPAYRDPREVAEFREIFANAPIKSAEYALYEKGDFSMAEDKKNAPRLTPQIINKFFEKSPSFRDAQDRAAFALAMTDPKSLDWLDKRMEYLAAKYPKQKEKIAQGKSYLERVKDTYHKASSMAFYAHKGAELPQSDSHVREVITDSLDRLTDDIKRKTQYRDFLLYTKQSMADKEDANKQPMLSDHDRGLLHNAGDTVMHSRFLAADDPLYGAHRLVASKAVLAGVGKS